MKISLRKTRKGITLTLSAQTAADGFDLKDAVMASAKSGLSPTSIIDSLRASGYTADLRNETRSGVTIECSRKEAV